MDSKMKKNSVVNALVPILMFVVFILGNYSIKAYTPALIPTCVLPICVEYSKSDSIFSGTFIKSVDDKSSDIQKVINTFRVNKIFKGKSAETVQVKFALGECDIKFEVGKKYLVYARKSKVDLILVADWLTRTSLLEKAQDDLKYIDKLHKSKKVFFVEGQVDGLSDDDIERVKVYIRENNNYIPIKIDILGEYQYKLTKDKKINVFIEIPFEVTIENSEGLKIVPHSLPSSNTLIEYEVNFLPNSCNYQKIIVNKVPK